LVKIGTTKWKPGCKKPGFFIEIKLTGCGIRPSPCPLPDREGMYGKKIKKDARMSAPLLWI
jgi:hypothetical protein